MPTELTAMNEVASRFQLHIRKEVEINAPIRVAYDAMLEEIGPGLSNMDGVSMGMKLEPWPGGRYFRDLSQDTGHLWGHVQVIKPPTLLEITGPLFMSYAAISHVQYRLTEQGRKTLLTITHRAFGEISDEHRAGVVNGWQALVERIRDRAQR